MEGVTGGEGVNKPIRVLIGKPGLDGHDVGAKLVCRSLMDAGMEVIYTGLRHSPRAIVRTAVEEEVDVIGLSVLSGAHLPLCRKMAEELAAYELSDVMWIVGGNIPKKDHRTLRDLGVDGIFPTGSSFDDLTNFVRKEVKR